MRFVVILAFIGAGAIAFADEPSRTPTQSAPAATPPSSAVSANTATDPRERILKAKGYRLETRDGKKVYCRSEEVLGSRLAAKKTCGTVEDLMEREHLSREMVEGVQRQQLNPTGK